MRSTKWFITASCLTVLGLLMASCAPAVQPTPASKAAPPPAATATTAPSPPKPAAPAPTAKPAAETPRYGGTLTIGVGGDPPSLDIQRETTAYTFALAAGAYNGPVKYDPAAWPEFKVIPDLATGWQISPDGKVYTFPIAKGAKFHDGIPLTAEDVKFSLDRIRDPRFGLTKSPRQGELANVTSIETPDDYTVRVTLRYPQASFLAVIGAFYYAVMPKRVVLEKKGDMTKTVLGTGPFKFKEYATGVMWELVKNPDYFVKGRPYLDGIKGYIIKDSFTRFAALRTRSILYWLPFPYMTVSQTKIIAETLSDKIAVKWEFLPAWYGAQFNVTKPPWNDVRLRQAVSLSFDRKKMLAVGLEGAGLVGMAAQPPGEWALPREEMEKVPGYAKPDLEAAKKLLAEAGYATGMKTDALVRADPPMQAMAVLIKDAVAAIGIDIDLNMQETAAFYDQRFRKAFTLIASSDGLPGTDPDQALGDFYVTGGGLNYAGYSNPRIDELYTKQSQTLDTVERRKIVWEMQRILLKDVPMAIAYWPNIPYVWWREVRGFNPPSIGHRHAYMFQEMWLAR